MAGLVPGPSWVQRVRGGWLVFDAAVNGPGDEGLPSRPTPSQRKAAEARGLNPEEQAARWKTHSGASERLQDTHARLDTMVRARFPQAEDVFEYNMRGWAIRRPIQITQWKGTVDPNWIRIYVAERKQGITIHLWDPYRPGGLGAYGLESEGFKPMVGCLQYNRKGPVPVEALAPLLDSIRGAWLAEHQ